MRKTLILFDAGSVLIRLNFSRMYEGYASLSKNLTPEDFEKVYKESGISRLFGSGKISTDEYLEKLRGIIKPDRDVSNEELKSINGYHLGKPIEEIIDLKKKLHENGYSVGIFSNTSELSFRTFSRKYPELVEVHGGPMICSYAVGAMKPDPRGYESVKGYDTVIFIDDKGKNLKTGIEQLGWKGILFLQYVDNAETERGGYSEDVFEETDDLKIAKSLKEVVEELRSFGVEI